MLESRRTGRDLRTLRLFLEVAQGDLAHELGVSRQRLSQIEGSRRPTPAAVARYLGALDRLAGR